MDDESTRHDPTLNVAWIRFAEFDTVATSRAKMNMFLRRGIAAAGVVTTFFALLSQSFATTTSASGLAAKYIPVLIPVIGAGLAAFAKIFNSASEGKIARASADAVLKEIYIYRTILRSTPYRQAYLEQKLSSIQLQFFRSMNGELPIKPYAGKIPPYYDSEDPMSDPGFNDLSGDDYFKYRLEYQLKRYRNNIRRNQDDRIRVQVLIIAATILIAILVVTGGIYKIGIELLASLTAAFLSWQEGRNIDANLKSNSKIALTLMQLQAHWEILEPEERTESEFFRLVKSCEDVLYYESSEYIRSMQETLHDAYNLEEEASLVNRVIRESVESSLRVKQGMQDALLEQTRMVLDVDDQKINEPSVATLGSLVKDASSEIVQQELEAMNKAVVETQEHTGQKASSSLTSHLVDIARDYAHVDIGKDTKKEDLNAILARYPKTGNVKG